MPNLFAELYGSCWYIDTTAAHSRHTATALFGIPDIVLIAEPGKPANADWTSAERLTAHMQIIKDSDLTAFPNNKKVLSTANVTLHPIPSISPPSAGTRGAAMSAPRSRCCNTLVR